MTQFGFEKLVYELPEGRNVDLLVTEAGYGDEMVSRLHDGGLREVPVSDDGQLSDLVNRVVRKINSTAGNLAERTAGVLFAHSIPVLAPDGISFLDECLEGVGLENTPRVAVSGQPCAILHSAIQLSMSWLACVPDGHGILLIGADQAYHSCDRIFFGSAMGDAAVAGFLSAAARENIVLSSITNTDIIATEGELSPPEQVAAFRAKNPAYIRHAIGLCLDAANVELEDLTFIVPHTPYNMIWDAVSELLRFPREKILTDYLPMTGHLNSNDSLIHYAHAIQDERLRSGELALLVNPAFGGTRGCTLLRR